VMRVVLPVLNKKQPQINADDAGSESELDLVFAVVSSTLHGVQAFRVQALACLFMTSLTKVSALNAN